MKTYKEIYRLSHFLRISLSTAGSRPQLEQAFKRLMSDSVAIEAGLETEMLVPPARLHVHLGTLSLDTPARVTAAIEHLRRLDIVKLHDSYLRRNSSENTRQALLKQSKINVNIHGLKNYGRYAKLARCMKLWALVDDEAGVFPALCSAIRLSLEQAELVQWTPTEKDVGIRETYTPIIDVRGSITDEDNDKPSLQGLPPETRKLAKRFDATQLCPKYRDFTWAQNVQLEKISLCRIGLKHIQRQGEIVGQGYEEVASIPLPGAPKISTGPDMEGDIYLYPPKRRSEKTLKPPWL